MSRDLIKIKGGANGFQLMIDSSADLAAVQEELERKLAENPEFFPEGTEFELVVADLNRSVRSGLKNFLKDRGLAVSDGYKPKTRPHYESQPQVQPVAQNLQPQMPQPQQPAPAKLGEEQMMTVINRTLRNGEEVVSQGSVMICGNINPGAQVIAAGSIDIRGTCRGIVHAGAQGDANAFIVADRLMPMQIRIANLIARSPDNPEESDQVEKAYIKDGQIIIEPIER